MEDTHPAALAVQIELLRGLGAGGRAAMAMRLSSDVVARSRRALEQSMPPGTTKNDLAIRWAELWYGKAIADRLRVRLEAP